MSQHTPQMPPQPDNTWRPQPDNTWQPQQPPQSWQQEPQQNPGHPNYGQQPQWQPQPPQPPRKHTGRNIALIVVGAIVLLILGSLLGHGSSDTGTAPAAVRHHAAKAKKTSAPPAEESSAPAPQHLSVHSLGDLESAVALAGYECDGDWQDASSDEVDMEVCPTTDFQKIGLTYAPANTHWATYLEVFGADHGLSGYWYVGKGKWAILSDDQDVVTSIRNVTGGHIGHLS